MRATIVAISALLLVTSVGASAAPIAAATDAGQTAASPLQLAQRDMRDGRWQRDHRRHDEMRRHDERRHGPPSGWHRYRARPHDYHRRGCMQIGPAWFCP